MCVPSVPPPYEKNHLKQSEYMNPLRKFSFKKQNTCIMTTCIMWLFCQCYQRDCWAILCTFSFMALCCSNLTWWMDHTLETLRLQFWSSPVIDMILLPLFSILGLSYPHLCKQRMEKEVIPGPFQLHPQPTKSLWKKKGFFRGHFLEEFFNEG